MSQQEERKCEMHQYRVEAKHMGSTLTEKNRGGPGGHWVEHDPSMWKRRPVVSQAALGVLSPE